MFLAGLVAAPPLLAAAGHRVAQTVPDSALLLVVAGLLVGFGTTIGSGCTSGHGVCGIARLSPRSLTATAVFMASALGTVFVARHLVGG
ncbi:YeeE/YedE family protein [Allostella humosa]|uniref:YeeE/YedE family protein n=1 Tax=Stella humosa TaxID=94 RepID=UPI0026BCCA59